MQFVDNVLYPERKRYFLGIGPMRYGKIKVKQLRTPTGPLPSLVCAEGTEKRLAMHFRLGT